MLRQRSSGLGGGALGLGDSMPPPHALPLLRLRLPGEGIKGERGLSALTSQQHRQSIVAADHAGLTGLGPAKPRQPSPTCKQQ